jgi:hypothetical protein
MAETDQCNATQHQEGAVCGCQRIAELQEWLRLAELRAGELGQEVTRLRGLLALCLAKLTRSGRYGLHRYEAGYHVSDCPACDMRKWLRKELEAK